jgi:hypothetical protein
MRVVKAVDRGGYRIGNVMYESQPDYWVTANLWIPTRGLLKGFDLPDIAASIAARPLSDHVSRRV